MPSDVRCPGCQGVYLQTTDKFDPAVVANGTMFDLKKPWKDYNWSFFPQDESVVYGGLVCPHCNHNIADSKGYVQVDGEEKPEEGKKEFVCDVCGKDYKAKSSLARHKAQAHQE